MGSVGSTLLRIGALMLLLRGVQLVTAMRALLGMRHRAEPATPCDESDLPDALRDALSRIDEWIVLGFEHAGWTKGGTTLEPPSRPPPFSRVLVRPGSGVWLHLRVSEAPEPGNLLAATLVSDRADGVHVETLDMPGASTSWIQFPERYRVELTPGYPVPDALDVHRTAAGDALVLDADLGAHLARRAAADEDVAQHLRARGDYVPGAGGGDALSFGAALRLARSLPANLRRATTERERRRAALGATVADVPVALELAQWELADASKPAPPSRAFAWLVLAGTGALFALSFVFELDLAGIAVIGAVVLFHELGHWAAMRLRGYHDARIFFVPFLGGATTGQKERASLADEMIVLLAGPVPGLALGAGLLVALGLLGATGTPPPELAMHAALMLIAINALNLLPFFPLDGGRIVHRLFASGRPALELLLRLGGIAGLAAIGVAIEAWILLLFALFMLLAVPPGAIVARIERDLRRAEPAPDRHARRLAILEHVRAGFPGAPFAVRLLRARELASRLDAPESGLLARAAWTTIYGACAATAVAPIAAFFVLMPLEGSAEPVYFECAGAAQLPAAGSAHVLEIDWEARPAPDALDALRLYAHAGASACVPVPWRAQDTTDAERAHLARAAATIRAIDVAEADALDGAVVGGEREDRRERAAAARAAVVARADRDPSLDPWVAAIYAAQLGWDPVDARTAPPPDAELASALRVPERCSSTDPARPRLTFLADEAFWLDASASDADLTGLVELVCDAGARGAWLQPVARSSIADAEP